MGTQESKLRGGATEYGRIYEQRIAAYLSIKCAMDPNVADFWILSNIDGVGAFDDIILWIKDIDGNKKLYCIQLKHIENNALKIKDLAVEKASKSKFSLYKYQEGYIEISKNINKIDILKDISMNQIYLILYTNAPLAGTKTDSILLKNKDSIELLNTSQISNNVFQVFNTDTSTNPLQENFLQQFYLFERQASASQMDRLIKNEFYSHFQDIGDSVLITITDFFAKWSMGKKGKIMKMFKTDVQRMLLEFLLLPHSMELSEVAGGDDEKLYILNDTLTNFNVTPIKREKFVKNIFASIKSILGKLCGTSLNFKVSWNTHLTTKQTDNLMAVDDQQGKQLIKKFLQGKQRYVPYLTIKDLYFAAWQCKKIPLVINCDIYQNSVEQILIKFGEVTKDLSFVLLNPSNIDDLNNNSNLNIFRNITDIKDGSLLLKNLENTHVSLQGKNSIQLREFIEAGDVLEQITPDVYMILMEGVLQFGETHEVEEYYIKRDLQRPLLSMAMLSENNVYKDKQSQRNGEGDIFVLVEFTGGIPLAYNKNTMALQPYLMQIVENPLDSALADKVYILTTDLSHTNEILMVIVAQLHLITKKAVHLLRVQQLHLEWLFSEGTVESLQDFIIDSTHPEENNQTCIHEDDILQHSTSRINVISNNAGMGKTFMLHSIANKFDPTHWVSYVNLSEHITAISGTDATDFIDYIFNHQVKKIDQIVDKFCVNIFVHCFRKGKVVWLLDGYDEVSTENVLPFLKGVKKMKVRTWITTRPTYKRELELEMDTLTLQLTHFSKNDHISFLWKYFQTFNHIYNYSQDQVQYIIDTINKVSSSLDKSFIAIPLQTRMFAEIFGDDINQINEKEQLTLVDLYNKFVNIKLKEYKSYEATSLKKTLSKLALKIFFKNDQLEDLLDFDELAEEALTFQESYKKDSIVIGLNEKGDAVFGHRTFAEFLAAHWLAKQIVTNKGNYNLNWVPLIEKLFYIEMLPVRAFFDRILSQNMPLHIAVLNNDKENVQLFLENEQLQIDMDKLGRSALHLAVSYGEYCDLYVASEIKGLRSVGRHSIITEGDDQCQLEIPRWKRSQNLVSQEIVEILIRRGFTNNADKLFNYDAFDYAMKSCSLGLVDILYSKFEKASLHFETGYNLKIFMYIIAYDNLHRILSERKVYDFDVSYCPQKTENKLRNMFKGDNFKLLQMKYNDAYLTEVAAFTGSKEIIYELLQSEALRVDMGHAVHKACFNGHVDVVDFLHKMGADLTKADEFGRNPIYQSGWRGRTDITYQFLKDRKFREKFNNVKTTLMTPLHYACQGGHPDCVKKLMECGADIRQKDAFGVSPLTYASIYGYASIIEPLLAGITKEELQCDKEIQSAINVAASRGYSDCVKKLLECGLDANNIDDEGNTPLILASQKGFPEVIKELVNSQRCDLNLMKTNETLDNTLWDACENQHMFLHTKLLTIGGNRKAFGTITALHLAVRHGHPTCVQTLIDLGADKSIADTVSAIGCRPLIWASMYGREKITEILLSKKSGPQEDLYDIDLALMWTGMLGYHECTKVLLEHIQDTEFTSCEDETVASKHLERVKKIIFAEFGLDARNIDVTGNLPMLFAAKNGHAKVIQELASTKGRYSEGLNADLLQWAARSGDVACVKLLVELGVDQNEKNTKGLRIIPIVWACMYGKIEVVKYFLSDKSESYLENRDLHLALNWAALGGFHEIVKFLLDFGLDVDNVDEELNGNTPLISACEYRGTVEVIDELLARNCIANKTNNDGLSALDFAVQKKQFTIVKRLINSEAYKDAKIDEMNSPLYQNLQLALDWATSNSDDELVHSLTRLGITTKIT